MAEVTIKYKDTAIASMSGTGSKTLNTSGKYCEGDVKVEYAPRSKVYELTLAKTSGWVLLTTLDDEVLEHINDENLTVTLQLMSDYTYELYLVNTAIVTNKKQGNSTNNNYPVYGISTRQNNATTIVGQNIYYPANKTDTSISLGNATFRVTDRKYYFKPSDGYVASATYKLTFTW